MPIGFTIQGRLAPVLRVLQGIRHEWQLDAHEEGLAKLAKLRIPSGPAVIS